VLYAARLRFGSGTLTATIGRGLGAHSGSETALDRQQFSVIFMIVQLYEQFDLRQRDPGHKKVIFGWGAPQAHGWQRPNGSDLGRGEGDI
jgi:hypothetical protein